MLDTWNGLRGWLVGFALALFAIAAPVCGAEGVGAKPHSGHSLEKTAGVTSLDVFAEGGRVHLLVARRGAKDAPAALEYLRSDDGGETWSDPRPAGAGQPPAEVAHSGMDVQVAAAGDRVVAAWTMFDAASRFGRGVIATSLSSDGGRTWRPGPNPADDGKAGDHAFIDLAADDRGHFHLAWLDARAGQKGLVYARSDDGGATWGGNAVLDAETCECCWNTLATAPGGRVLLLYRDKNPRDMALVASADGGRTWAAPAPVGRFNWTFEGCPHVGGGLATAQTAAGLRAYAVVWTGRADAAGVYALASPDGGKTWATPIRLGDGTAWHADVAAGTDRVTAVFDARAGDDTAVFASTSRDAGKTWPAGTRLSPAGTSASYPRVIFTAKGFRAFWTEKPEGKPAQWRSRAVE